MTDSADCVFSFYSVSVFFLFSFLFAPLIVFAQPLCTCHSKRPATVAMHQAVKGRNCFSCHARGEKLRKKGGIPPEKHAEFLRRRTREPQCLECHGKDGSVKDAAGSGNDEAGFFEHSFCPQCRKKGPKGRKTCEHCGGPVLDLAETFRKSALNPDAAICKQCHFPDEQLAATHLTHAEEPVDSQTDCLKCHQGHNQCGGCHDSESSADSCPHDLVDAGKAYIAELQLFQNKIRQSDSESPLGLQETMQFDRAAHFCHGGPAQAVKDFSLPQCISSDKEGVFILKYPYQVRYRQAATVKALYEAPWEEGSDGFLLVEFFKENEKWKVAGEKESIK